MTPAELDQMDAGEVTAWARVAADLQHERASAMKGRR